jgi:hypothetical protein
MYLAMSSGHSGHHKQNMIVEERVEKRARAYVSSSSSVGPCQRWSQESFLLDAFNTEKSVTVVYWAERRYTNQQVSFNK